jgi:hypothetical protein
MKTLMPLTLLLFAGMLAAGCASPKVKKAPAPVARTSQTVVTPDNSLTARVASYNATGRVGGVSFPVSQMPKLDQTLFLYRDGFKVAEVKVTGPQRDNNVVADLISGDTLVGDEVRSE